MEPTHDTKGLTDTLAELFESFAGVAWLQAAHAKSLRHRISMHPIVRNWSLARAASANGGRVPLDGGDDTVFSFCRMYLDAVAIHMVREGLGYDNHFFRRLASVVRDAEQFANTMAEISAAGWCMSNGLPINPCVGERMPEFSVHTPEDLRPIYVECKRPQGSVSEEQLRQQFRRANRKLVPNDRAGPLVLILDVEEHLGLVLRSMLGVDTPSASVQRCIDFVAQQATRTTYRNITAIGLTWIDYFISEPTAGGGAAVGIRRVTQWVDHFHARRPFASQNPLLGYAVTMLLRVSDLRGRRNRPCFCGSGLRFKNCHGRLV